MSNPPNNKLKPLSDFARSLLASLGETPEDHQKKMQARINGTYTTRAFSTEKQKPLRQLNREAEAKLTFTEPTKTIIERLQSPEFQPEAYIIFIRHWHCKQCKEKGVCMDYGGLYLRYKKRDKDEMATRIYQPVQSIEHKHLPRLREAKVVALPVCDSCFDAKPQSAKPEPYGSHSFPVPHAELLSVMHSAYPPLHLVQGALDGSQQTTTSDSSARPNPDNSLGGSDALEA